MRFWVILLALLLAGTNLVWLASWFLVSSGSSTAVAPVISPVTGTAPTPPGVATPPSPVAEPARDAELESLRAEVQELQQALVEARTLLEEATAAGGEEAPADAEMVELRDALEEAWAEAQGWVEAALQTSDPAARAAALARILAAMQSSEESSILVGLRALHGVAAVEFDHEPFHQRVLELLGSDSARIRFAALSVLPAAGGTRDDIPRILPLARDEDPTVRAGMASAAGFLGATHLEGELARTMLDLLADDDPQVVRQAIWASHVVQEAPLEYYEALARFLEDPELVDTVIHFAFNRGTPMPPVVIDGILTALEKGQAEPQTAFSALGRSLPEDLSQYGNIADRVLRLLESRGHPYYKMECATLLGRIGNAGHLYALEGLAARGGHPEYLQQALDRAITTLRSRLGR